MSDRLDPPFSAPDRDPADLDGVRILVFGLGGFGGGAGAARFLAEQGAAVTVTDLRTPDQLGPALEILGDVPLAGRRLGGHDITDFTETDWVVVNPAIRPGNPLLSAATRAGARLVTEVGVFLSWCPSPHVAGITGSNGKSTTCRLLAEFLEESGHRTHLGGNFGGSLLLDLPRMTPDDRVVVELSSFQLARLGPDTPRPAAVGITQISANHLDWHGTYEAYRTAKEQLLRSANSALPRALQIAALPRGETKLMAGALLAGRPVVSCGADRPQGSGVGVQDAHLCAFLIDEDGSEEVHPLVPISAFPRQGRHEIENAAVACALAFALGADRSVFEPVIARQLPLPHRQEDAGEIAGIRFVDDSKATTPEATCAALEAFSPRSILLAGGHHKGGDLTELARMVRERATGAICYGRSRHELARALDEGGVEAAKVQVVERFADAFRRATEVAREGDVILLSPACASFDEFRSFEERGEVFRGLVEGYRQQRAT
jgi:UDP-N-acetylmuramoylalanine--D-glutamate ligase